MEQLRVSEYDHKYQAFDVATYGGSGKRLNKKSAPASPLPDVALSYESTYDVMTARAKSGSRKGPKTAVAEEVAHKAAVRTNKRRMSIAVEEAATLAREIAEEKAFEAPATEMHPELSRRFSMIALEAASKAANVVPSTSSKNRAKGASIALGSDTQWSSSTWGSEYDSGYQAPIYLEKMAKAVEEAAVAAIQFKRETGLCSEYLANFEDFDTENMARPSSNKPEDGNQVGACLDFTEADAVSTAPTTHSFIPRRVAWSSEYSASFNDGEETIEETITSTARDTALSNANGNQVMECMDWVPPAPSAAPAVDDASSSEPTPTSMYTNDFQRFKYVPQAAFRPSQVTEISACMDWAAAQQKSSNGAPRTRGSSADSKTSTDDWVMVETPRAPSNNAVIPGWGSVKSSEQMITTYDWDYEGGWKKFAKSSSSKRNNINKKKQANSISAKDVAAKAAQKRQARITAMATQKGVGKQSANELYVAEKMLPFFATGSEYQKKYSVPAAVRSVAVAKVVKEQKTIASKIRKVNQPKTENNPILRGRRLGLNNQINMTSYQSHFGAQRQPSMAARIRQLAAAEKKQA